MRSRQYSKNTVRGSVQPGNSNVPLDTLIERHGRILKTQNAGSRDISSLQNWIAGNRCIARAETAYLNCNDLFGMAEGDDALTKVENLVEDFMIQNFAHIYKVIHMSRGVTFILKRYSAAAPTSPKIQMSIFLLEHGLDV